MKRNELDACLNQYLEVPNFRDYCPNGRQVEGHAEARKIVSSATRSLVLPEAALEAGADVVLAHHGCCRESGDARLAGPDFAALRC